MTAATPTGAELRARREALGMSVDAAEQLPGMSGVSAWGIEACGGDPNCSVCPGDIPAYAAALAAEEARRAEPEVWEPAARKDAGL